MQVPVPSTAALWVMLGYLSVGTVMFAEWEVAIMMVTVVMVVMVVMTMVTMVMVVGMLTEEVVVTVRLHIYIPAMLVTNLIPTFTELELP